MYCHEVFFLRRAQSISCIVATMSYLKTEQQKMQ